MDLTLIPLQLFGGVLLTFVVLFPVFLLLGAGWWIGGQAFMGDVKFGVMALPLFLAMIFAGVIVWSVATSDFDQKWWLAAVTAIPAVALFAGNFIVAGSIRPESDSRLRSIFKVSLWIWMCFLAIAYLFLVSDLLRTEFGISI